MSESSSNWPISKFDSQNYEDSNVLSNWYMRWRNWISGRALVGAAAVDSKLFKGVHFVVIGSIFAVVSVVCFVLDLFPFWFYNNLCVRKRGLIALPMGDDCIKQWFSTISSLFKIGTALKGKICSQRERILSFRSICGMEVTFITLSYVPWMLQVSDMTHWRKLF